jgi:hypothetical protein
LLAFTYFWGANLTQFAKNKRTVFTQYYKNMIINNLMLKGMKSHVIITVMILLAASVLNVQAQKVFKVQYESQADLKVYIVQYESQADLNVYFVKYESQASRDGLWFTEDYESQAEFKLFFVNYESQADLKIYIVDYESQAGWKTKSKQHLLHFKKK